MKRVPFVLKAEKLPVLRALILTLTLFAWTGAYAQITPSGDSYINTADPSINHLSRTMLGYFAAIEIAFTILVALACAAVLALIGIYISNEARSLKSGRKQNRSSLNLVQLSIKPRLLLE